MRKRISSVVAAMMALVAGAERVCGQSEAREAGYLYLSPVPGASYVSPGTRCLLVRLVDVLPSEVTNLTTSFVIVDGASSGLHTGVTTLASDGRTVILEMSQPFTRNELATVTLDPQVSAGASGTLERYEYQFRITAPMPGSLPLAPLSSLATESTAGSADSGNSSDRPDPGDGPRLKGPQSVGGKSIHGAMILPNGVSVPSDFPEVLITVNNDPSPGYLFLDNYWFPDDPRLQFTLMVDNNGWPVWYHRSQRWDLKIQDNGMITWGSAPQGLEFATFTGCDHDFNYVRTYQAGNGYGTDNHELQVLPDGSYLIIGYRVDAVDLSLHIPGGQPGTSVRETVVQEFTTAGELIFQWRAWDHYDIADAGWDFTHMNAMDIDEDGHILVSSRQLSEVTKINRDSGEIIWRLGGSHGGFTFLNDPLNGFRFQHAITALGNHRYLLFDNGNTRSPLVSRAVEYQLDLTNMTATLVWQFRDTPDKYAWWMGNAQRLPTGNTLINFVRPHYPKVIEVDPEGTKKFELTLVPNGEQYRAFRFPWTGAVSVPYLLAEPDFDNVTLIFNKFGDQSVESYRIYAGTAPAPTTLVATSSTTLKRLTNVVRGAVHYFRVTAVSTNGVESGFSNEESLMVNITLPGENMVRNGDFSQGTNEWNWEVRPPAVAQWDQAGGIGHVQIASAGGGITDIQLKQGGMPLTQGKEYRFGFDAWSAAPRTFEAKVEEDTDPGINYSGIQPFVITPVASHYEFTFTMGAPSDYRARVVFNAGALAHDVYLDNISLVERVYAAGDFDYDGSVGFNDLKTLTDDWQRQGILTADLNGDGRVDFADYAVFAENWSGGMSSR